MMGAMTAFDIPRALHRGEDELPFVDLGDGSEIQLLQCDVEAGLWVVRSRFRPGYVVPTHKHTGEVFAVTLAGSPSFVLFMKRRGTADRKRGTRRCQMSLAMTPGCSA